MEPHGYYPVPFTTVLLAQNTRETKSFLCVDNFGVKYFSKDDVNHLLDSRKKYYAISADWEGHNYLKFTVYWNYSKE